MSPLSVLALFFVALLVCRAAAGALRRLGSPATVLEIGFGFVIGNYLLQAHEVALMRGFAELGTVILFV